MTINVLEIRNYLFKPDAMEHFIDYFEEHFIETQQALNIQVLGQFRLVDQPKRFVWIRGFESMQTRLDSLTSFYKGPVWEKYGPAANDRMIEWHDVHLVRPIGNITDLTRGANAETVAADLAAGTISYETGLIVIDFFQAKPSKRDALIEKFRAGMLPVYRKLEVQVRGLFVAEMAANEFTRHPAIQNENELIVITAYENRDAYWDKCELMSRAADVTSFGLIGANPQTLLLSPTLRSPIRYVKG